jgi:hypothetical protein
MVKLAKPTRDKYSMRLDTHVLPRWKNARLGDLENSKSILDWLQHECTSWYMMISPSKTPPGIIAKLNAEAVKALRTKENVEALAKAGNDPVANTPPEAMQFLKVEIARWGKVIKMAGVAPQ